jgi:hypothetical protein
MGSLTTEWQLWAIVNGVPAFLGGLLFIGAPALRRIAGRLGIRLWDWIGFFDERFAWNIHERRDALLLGVGYVFRGLLFLQVLLAVTWVEIRWIVWGNVLFAAVLLIVTMVWGDLFQWRRPTAVGWLFLYIEEPVWMLTLVPRTEAIAAAAPAGPALPGILVVLLLVEAAAMFGLGLYLFFFRPRPPDRVSPRMIAGFALGWTGWSIALAMAGTWSEAQWGIGLDVFWLVGSAIVLLLARRGLAGRSTMGEVRPG